MAELEDSLHYDCSVRRQPDTRTPFSTDTTQHDMTPHPGAEPKEEVFLPLPLFPMAPVCPLHFLP